MYSASLRLSVGNWPWGLSPCLGGVSSDVGDSERRYTVVREIISLPSCCVRILVQTERLDEGWKGPTAGLSVGIWVGGVLECDRAV